MIFQLFHNLLHHSDPQTKTLHRGPELKPYLQNWSCHYLKRTTVGEPSYYTKEEEPKAGGMKRKSELQPRKTIWREKRGKKIKLQLNERQDVCLYGHSVNPGIRLEYQTSLTVKEKEETGPLWAGSYRDKSNAKFVKQLYDQIGPFNGEGWYTTFTTKELVRNNLIHTFTVAFKLQQTKNTATFNLKVKGEAARRVTMVFSERIMAAKHARQISQEEKRNPL